VTINEALAQAYAEHRQADLDVKRAPIADIEDYLDLCQIREDLLGTLTRLLEANAAHELEWCHDSTECPLCTGEVTR
jgi:predicted RNA polymerase sigma factor